MSESSQDGVQSWTDSMSARDRIRAVAETLRELRSVNWVSEQDVGELSDPQNFWVNWNRDSKERGA